MDKLKISQRRSGRPASYNYYETEPFPVDRSTEGVLTMKVGDNRGSGIDNFRQKPPDKEESRIQCLKYCMFVFNLIFFLIGCIIVGVGIWLAVDRNFMATISGSMLIEVAAYIFIAAGGLVLIIAFFGCCGSINDNKCLLWVYLIVLCIIMFLLLISGILAIVFRSQIGQAVRKTMRDTLKERYGVDQHLQYNRAVTHAWDKAQERLFCCAVDDQDWGVYRETKWLQQFGAQDALSQSILAPEEQKPFVPRSCCVRDRFYRYVDREACQKWRLGPPAQNYGAINRALYYDGCFNAGKRYIIENSSIIIGFGFTLLILMVSGIIGSVCLIRKMP